MTNDVDSLPLNSVRAFVTIARERSVTKAATALGTTQSAVSRHLAVLEAYLGAELIERRGRYSDLTEFGRLYASAVSEPMDAIFFATQRMRRRSRSEINRLVVRTSLSTFAYTVLIPNLQEFSNEMGGAIVDVVSSLSPPASTDGFDVLITRDLALSEPSDHWEIHREKLVCVGLPRHVSGKSISTALTLPVLTITSRPDILPTWIQAMSLRNDEVKLGAHYDHHYLALPAVTTGKCLLVAPEIVVSGLVAQGLLQVVAGSRTPSGMDYRAYAIDRSGNPDLARAFCRWLVRACRKGELMASREADPNIA